MPVSPQITITPETIVTKNFDISAVSFTSSTATYTATGHTFSTGENVLISGLAPDGYNGNFTITGTATNTFTVSNTTNVAVTDAIGNAFWTDSDEFEFENLDSVFVTDNNDLSDPDINPALATALAAQADAATAQANAATAYATAVSANTAASTAQTTANGKNKVTYSTATPGTTANTAGDIWFQYGTSGVNNGRIIAQYTGGGGSTWTQTTISGSVLANLDAGSITAGTLSVALGITGTSGNFSVNAVTGALVASSATITGAVNAISGYFGSTTNGYSISSTGLTGVGTGAITGGTIQTSTGNQAVILNGSSNAIQFKSNGSIVANMLPLKVGSSSFGLLMHYGATPDESGGTRPQVYIGSSNVSLSASSSVVLGVSDSIGVTISTGSIGTSISGPLEVNGRMNYTGISTGSGSTMVLVSTGSRVAYTTSSERFKQDIEYIKSDGWLDKVLSMQPIKYRTSTDFAAQDEPNEIQVGFLAEDINDIGGGFESSVVLDPLGDPFSLSYERLTVFLTLAIKELKKEIDTLKGEANGI